MLNTLDAAAVGGLFPYNVDRPIELGLECRPIVRTLHAAGHGCDHALGNVMQVAG